MLHDVGRDEFRIRLRPCWLAILLGARDQIMRVRRVDGQFRNILTDTPIGSSRKGRFVLRAFVVMPAGVYVTIGHTELPALRPGEPAGPG